MHHLRVPFLVIVSLLLPGPFHSLASSQPSPPELSAANIESNGWTRVTGLIPDAPWDSLLTLEASADLRQWKTIAVLHAAQFSFLDPAAASLAGRYYKFRSEPLTAENNDWKNQIKDYNDPFGGSYIKFVIYKSDPTRVFYSDGSQHQFHYDFVSRRLPGYIGIDGSRFQEITRYNDTRELYIGSVVHVPSETEYAIQFDSIDPLPPADVVSLFRLVQSTIVNGRLTNAPPMRAFYLPSFEQLPSARLEANFFETNGIPLATLDRWTTTDTAYALGRTVGRLRFVPSTNINTAYAEGTLLATDILLTDGIPAEIPFVAGIISLTPATPNSHVAILARSYNVPFVYFHDEAMRQQILTWTNREVALEAVQTFYGVATLSILPLDPDFPADLRAEMLSFTGSGQLQITPKARYGSYTTPTDNLVPSDIRYFGGKAANFGILRRTIPSNSPPAIAFSLDLWDDFISQQLVTGRTLRDEIAFRLKPYTNGNDIAGLKSTLNGIRDLIRKQATFTPEQRQVITNALRVFDPSKKIRFRSSTNVEDAESFTGAGLYDSFSGCLLDDLDNDTSGPCLCEAEEPEERGVFRAIQRVYSSFYNDNAVLARLRFRLNEDQVGMGILVHHSTPDEIELANGVATVTRREFSGPGGFRDYQSDLVTQLGPASVTNPDSAAQPEVITAFTTLVTNFQIQQNSNLLPFGQQVLTWAEYDQLVEDLFIPVTEAWHALDTNKSTFALDFEYKKIDPGFLQVKQVREIPLGDLFSSYNAFLLKQTVQRETHQGVGAEAFSTHRAKTRWSFTTRNMRLTETNVADGIFENISFERNANGRIEQFSGPPSTLPNYRFWQTNAEVHSTWTMDTADGPATFELTGKFYSFQRRAIEPLFLTPKDLPIGLTITYGHTNLSRFEWWGEIEFGGTDLTGLDPIPQRSPGDVQFTHELLITNQVNTNLIVKVNTSYWLDGPEIYTSYPRLVGNLTTRIEGLTAEPINLTGFFSQTVEGEHIVNSERFIFEPRIEPGISPAILAELEAQNIQQIVLTHRFGIPRLRLVGNDRQLRDW